MCGIVGRVAQQLMCVCLWSMQTSALFKRFGQKLGQGFHVTQIRAAKLCQVGNSGRYATIFANLAVTQSRNLKNE